MVEYQEGVPIAESLALLPGQPDSGPAPFTPSPRLRQALVTLRERLHQELGEQAAGKRHWLLLEGSGGRPAESLEVGKVLEELRQRFQELQSVTGGPAANQSPPDLESYLREKMRQMGFEELAPGPLLPELQREALRGLGVGLGSQMAQLLGRLAGWHADAKLQASGKPQREPKSAQPSARILRLEVGPRIATSKAAALHLRGELTKARRDISSHLGWEISGLHLALAKECPDSRWRLFLRAEMIAEGNGLQELLARFEPALKEHAANLLTFEEFDAITRQPGCRATVRELRSQGLEKAILWTLFRRRLAQGADLRDPLTLFERILEASVVSLDSEHLFESLISEN